MNAPSLVPKYLRYANRVSMELGVADEVKAFEEAAAAFPNRSHIIAATCVDDRRDEGAPTRLSPCAPLPPPHSLCALACLLLPSYRLCSIIERPPVILRDLEPWELDYHTMAEGLEDRYAKRYPQQLIDQITASSNMAAGGGGSGGEGAGAAAAEDAAAAGGGDGDKKAAGKKGKDKKKGGKEEGEEAGAAAAAAGEGDKKAAAGKASSASSTSSSSAAAAAAGGEEGAEEAGASAAMQVEGGLAPLAPRVSMADRIADIRSLDRAYTQRLVLLVKRASDGQWVLPGGVVQPKVITASKSGQVMPLAARKHVTQSLEITPDADLWYVGRAPIGHTLTVYPPEVQQATGAYGSKTFYYRAELLKGKIRATGKPVAAPEAAKASGVAAEAYADWCWVPRDATEAYLPRTAYKYLHQIMGAGPGEEATRRSAWLEKLAAATGKQKQGGKAGGEAAAVYARYCRTHAYKTQRGALRDVATATQAALAARKHSAEKTAAVRSELLSLAARKARARAVSEALRVQLATPNLSVTLSRFMETRKAERAAKAAAAGTGSATA